MRNLSLRPLLAPLFLLALSACSGGGGESGPRGGTAREYTRTDSSVTVAPGVTFTASKVVTLSNDDAGAGRAAVRLRTVNGNVTGSGAAADDYQIRIALQATAPSEEQARAALASMTVEHRDGAGDGALYLDTEVVFAQGYGDNVVRTANVTATLPADLDYALHEETVNGASAVSGLNGSDVALFSTNGDVTVTGTWDDAAAHTVNGAASASGDLASLQASTVNGAVQATQTGTRNSVAGLDSSTGSIDAKVNHTANAGFDLSGDSDTGTVTILVAGTEPVGTPTANSAHYRSPNYAGRSPRARIVATSSTGSIAIHE